MAVREYLNARFDAVVRPHFLLPGGRRCPAFRACGFAGLLAAITFAVIVVVEARLSLAVLGAITAGALMTFVALALITRLLVGEEELIYFHHEMAILLVAAALASALDQPVLPYLDVTVLGVGMFLAFGRIGCLLVGCCHGRPCRWGVRYRMEHGAAGFPEHYVGVRLVPVQALESVVVGAVIIVGGAVALGHAPPGTVLAWYVVAYDAARFLLEFLRGDATRRYVWGASEGQWLAVILTCAVVWGEHAGWLPVAAWHPVVAAAMVLALVVRIAGARVGRGGAGWVLLQARHVREIAVYLRSSCGALPTHPPTNLATSRVPFPRVAHTSLGLLVSSGKVAGNGDWIEHFTLSMGRGPLRAPIVRSIGRFICRFRGVRGSPEVIHGASGVFHLVIR